jgi:hypothetical protein
MVAVRWLSSREIGLRFRFQKGASRQPRQQVGPQQRATQTHATRGFTILQPRLGRSKNCVRALATRAALRGLRRGSQSRSSHDVSSGGKTGQIFLNFR